MMCTTTITTTTTATIDLNRMLKPNAQTFLMLIYFITIGNK
jgi:hypothetical protein